MVGAALLPSIPGWWVQHSSGRSLDGGSNTPPEHTRMVGATLLPSIPGWWEQHSSRAYPDGESNTLLEDLWMVGAALLPSIPGWWEQHSLDDNRWYLDGLCILPELA
jgi:hypothetical protein